MDVSTEHISLNRTAQGASIGRVCHPLGDKIHKIKKLSSDLIRAGFKVNQHLVIDTLVVNRFLASFGGSFDQASPKTILNPKTNFTEEIWEIIDRAVEDFKSTPLMIRSSAAGDAYGTGGYYSGIANSNREAVAAVVRKVIASYFTESTSLIRKDANLASGIAVGLEPVIGDIQVVHSAGPHKVFAPVVSGIAFSESSKGPYALGVKGFADKLVNDPGIGAVFSLIDGGKRVEDKLSRTQDTGRYYDFDKNQIDIFPFVELLPWDFLEKFTKCMEQFRKLHPTPHYFEWAIKTENEKPSIYINQVAEMLVPDALNEADRSYLKEVKDHIFVENAAEVIGEGRVNCDKIFHIRSSQSLDELYRFNKANRNYILMLDKYLISRNVAPKDAFRYRHYSNASVILAKADRGFGVKLVAHIGGMFRLAHKLAASVGTGGENKPPVYWQGNDFSWKDLASLATSRKLGSNNSDRETVPYEVLEIPTTVIASEKDQRLVVLARDN